MAVTLGQLYQVESPLQKSMSMLSGAAGTAGQFQQKPYDPGKTVGGGLMSGLGGAGAGASIGTALAAGAAAGTSMMPGIGTAVGAGVGLLAYYLS